MRLIALIFTELTQLVFSVRRTRRAFDQIAEGAEALLAAEFPDSDDGGLPDGVTIPEAIEGRLSSTGIEDMSEAAAANGKTKGRKKKAKV